MVIVSRAYGSPVDIQNGNLEDLESSATAGQQIGIIATQNIRMALDETGHTILNTDSLDPIAAAVRIGTGAEVNWINLSWNEGQYVDPTQGLVWYAESFVGVIVVSPGELPVNGRNILNSLSGTFLSYLQTGPFTIESRVLGASSTPASAIAGNILNQLKQWIIPKSNYSETYVAPQNAGIVNKGVITGVQDEDRFSPMNTLAYLPLSQELTEFEIALIAIAAFLARKPEGRKQIFDLAEAYMKNITNLLVAVVNSGKTHPLTALNASTEFAVLAHRFGLITDSGYLKMADQTRNVIDKMFQLDFIDVVAGGIQTLVETGLDVSAAAQPWRNPFPKP